MMTNKLTLLKQIAGFPLLTQDEVLKLKNERHRNLLRLRRLAHLEGVTEEKERGLEKELETIRFYDQLAAELIKPCSAYNLLADFNPCELDNETAEELITYWEEQFTSALEQELNPLSLLMFLEEHASSPILLTALTHSLLKREISAASLIHSGLFHRYYIRHVAQIDNVISTYSLLAQTHSLSHPSQLAVLLEQIKQLAAPQIRGIELTSLSGHEVFKEPLDVPLTPPAFSVTSTKENLTQLNRFFGDKFLIELLLSPLTEDLNTWFGVAIPEMSINRLEMLYTYILNSIAAEQRPHVLKRLSQYSSDDQTIQMLESARVSLWVVFAHKPSLITQINEDKIATWIMKTPITLNDMHYALQCMKHPLFKPFDEEIHVRVLNLLMCHPTAELTSSIRRRFKNNPKATRWCALYSQQLGSDFKKDIQSNLPLTEGNYITICDSYTRTSRQWRMLEQLSPSPLNYPRDIYGAQSLIIKTLFDNQILDLNYFNIFHPISKYQDYDHPEQLKKEAQERTLLTCLTEQNDADFQEWIINLLYTECSKPFWQVAYINGVSVLNLAIEHNNTAFLKRYYSELDPKQRLSAVKEQNKEGNTVLHCSYAHPESLTVILSLLPHALRLSAVFEKNRSGYTVLHLAAHKPKSLTALLSFFPKNERFKMIKEKSRFCETLMDLVLPNPASIHAILSLLPVHQRLAALNESTDYCIKINQSWGEHRQVLKSYIKKLQTDLKHLERITEDRIKVYQEPVNKKSLDYVRWNKLKVIEGAQLELMNPKRNIDENIEACIAHIQRPEHLEILSKIKDPWLEAATKMAYSPEVILIYKHLMGSQASQGLNSINFFFNTKEQDKAHSETHTEQRFES